MHLFFPCRVTAPYDGRALSLGRDQRLAHGRIDLVGHRGRIGRIAAQAPFPRPPQPSVKLAADHWPVPYLAAQTPALAQENTSTVCCAMPVKDVAALMVSCAPVIGLFATVG